LGHTDNYIIANPLITPPHIVPEWYFLPFYAILRACPDKIGGAIAMFSALLILLLLPRTTYRLVSKYNINIIILQYGIFINFVILG